MIHIFRTAILRTDLWGPGRTIEFYYDAFDPVRENWEETDEYLFYTEPAILPAFEVNSESEPVWSSDKEYPRGTILDRLWDGKQVTITHGKKTLLACGSVLLHYARNLEFGLSIVNDRWNEVPIMTALGDLPNTEVVAPKPKAKAKVEKESNAEFDLFGEVKKATRKRKAKA